MNSTLREKTREKNNTHINDKTVVNQRSQLNDGSVGHSAKDFKASGKVLPESLNYQLKLDRDLKYTFFFFY